MPAYTPQQIRPFIGSIPGNISDAELEVLTAAVESQIQTITGIMLNRQTITEYASGKWTPRIRLLQYPVFSVTTVRVRQNGDNMGGQDTTPDPAPDASVPGEDYWLKYDSVLNSGTRYSRSGLLVSRGDWPGAIERERGRLALRRVPANANIEVIYEAGFPTGEIPGEFLVCVAAGVKQAALQLKTGGLMVTSESLDGWSQSGEQIAGRLAPPIPGMAAVIGSTLGMIAAYMRPRVL